MGNFFINLINGTIKGLGAVLSFVFSVLPPSPFKVIAINSDVKQFLGYINYLLPLNECLAILEAWTAAIGIYYIYQIALRWLKAID